MNRDEKTILVVEDNEEVLRLNEKVLARHGYKVLAASTLARAQQLLETNPVDLIVLDIVMPDGSGLDFCRRLRETNTVPIVFLTGKHAPPDIISGLQSGGDDYITKPYRLDELLARIEAQLRRCAFSAQQTTGERLECGPLLLTPSRMTAFLHGEDLHLTPKEFSILQVLVQKQGRAVSAQELYAEVWGTAGEEDLNAVWTHISRLRRKMDIGPDSDINITAERGQGYVLYAPRQAPTQP